MYYPFEVGPDGRQISAALRNLASVAGAHSTAAAEGAALAIRPAILEYASESPDNLEMIQLVGFDWCGPPRRPVLAPHLRRTGLPIADMLQRVTEIPMPREASEELGIDAEELTEILRAVAMVIGAIGIRRPPAVHAWAWAERAPSWMPALCESARTTPIGTPPDRAVMEALRETCRGRLPAAVDFDWLLDWDGAALLGVRLGLLWRRPGGALLLADALAELRTPWRGLRAVVPELRGREWFAGSHVAMLLLRALGIKTWHHQRRWPKRPPRATR